MATWIPFVSESEEGRNWLRYRGATGNGNTSHSISPPLAIRWKIPLQTGIEETVPSPFEDGILDSLELNRPSSGVRAFNPPLVEDQIIYFGSIDKNFYAFDLRSGYMRWIFPTSNEVNSVPYIHQNRIFFGSNDGRLYAVDKETGEELWSFQSGQTIQSLISGWQDLIIFTSDQGYTFFLNQENGTEQHRIPNLTWSHHTFQIYDGIIFWAPFSGGFGAYDIQKRDFLWSIQVPRDRAVWYSYPAVTEDRVFFASNFYSPGVDGTSGFLKLVYYALDRHSGEIVWQEEADFDFPADIAPDSYNGFLRHIELLDYLAPALWGDLVVFTSGDRIVRAFGQEKGELIWEQKLSALTSSAPTIGYDRVYFGTHMKGAGDAGNDGREQALSQEQKDRAPQLMCLSVRNGKILWQVPLEGAVLAAPVIADDAIYLGTDRHIFYVLEEVF